MFDWLKKKTVSPEYTASLASEMVHLMNAAKWATCLTVIRDYGFADSASEEETAVGASIATSITNHLFDEPEKAVPGMDMAQMRIEAKKWLKENAQFRELIIQSLRIKYVMAFAKSGEVQSEINPLLTEFGEEYPYKPNPDLYKLLVNRAIESLPIKEGQSILFKLKSGEI